MTLFFGRFILVSVYCLTWLRFKLESVIEKTFFPLLMIGYLLMAVLVCLQRTEIDDLRKNVKWLTEECVAPQTEAPTNVRPTHKFNEI